MLDKKILDGVLTLTLDRPEIHNAFNDNLIGQITEEFQNVCLNDEVRVIVFTGSGKSFCAGADLNWMKSMVDFSEEENLEDSRKLYRMFETINSCSKPVIGIINGHALGGGMGLLSVCDYTLTHEKAKFGFTETKLGLIPAVISSFCFNKIGENFSRAYFISGERFSAMRAKEIGIIHEVTSLESFKERSKELILSFLSAAPNASVDAKELIQKIKYLDDAQDYTCLAIAKKRVSSEGQEGMKALLSKRKPKWVVND